MQQHLIHVIILPLVETVKPRRRQRLNIPQEEMDDPSWEAAPVKKAINTEVENSAKPNCTAEKVSIENTELKNCQSQALSCCLKLYS